MRVAILDDEQIFVDSLYKLLWKEMNFELFTYTDPNKLLEDYSLGKRFDIIFCDVIMEPFNGIEVGKKIRTYDSTCFIIYLTSDLSSAPKGYEVNAFRYLIKPIDEKSLSDTLESIREEIHSKKKRLLRIDASFGSIILNTADILYIEANNKDTAVYTDDDSITVRKNLTDFEEELSGQHFCRIHRSILVNLERISQYDSSHITLDNGNTLSLSRRRYRDFESAFNAFISGE